MRPRGRSRGGGWGPWRPTRHSCRTGVRHTCVTPLLAGVVRAGVPDTWLLAALYALVYSAAELVASGHLAPRDAPRLVVDTFLSGLGTTDGGPS